MKRNGSRRKSRALASASQSGLLRRGLTPQNKKPAPRRVWGPERFAASRSDLDNYLFLLSARDKLRDFLREKGYLEILVPVMSPETVPDLNLESFAVKFQSVFQRGQKATLYLQTSPELMLKRLLASGFEAIFYLGPVFRQGEFAEKHHPEFTMAEWYRARSGYQDLMAEIEEMLTTSFSVPGPIPRMTMRQALVQAAGIDFIELQNPGRLARALARKTGGFDPKDMDFGELLEFAMVQWLDPWLEGQAAIFIYDWPAEFSMQARLKPGEKKICERFELYLHGIEIANGYTESTDAAEMEKRFRAEAQKRKNLKRKPLPIPQTFLRSLSRLPACAGVSLGLERLCLALLGLDNLDRIMPFREL